MIVLPLYAAVRFGKRFGVKMGENIMLNINTTEKPMPRIGKLNADRYHMQEVYRRKILFT